MQPGLLQRLALVFAHLPSARGPRRFCLSCTAVLKLADAHIWYLLLRLCAELACVLSHEHYIEPCACPQLLLPLASAEHKESTGCNGKRDRAAFLKRSEYDERAFHAGVSTQPGPDTANSFTASVRRRAFILRCAFMRHHVCMLLHAGSSHPSGASPLCLWVSLSFTEFYMASTDKVSRMASAQTIVSWRR